MTKRTRSLPNILWIVLDSLRADHVGCYGYHRNTSPTIDQIAAGGVKYKRAVAQANCSLPSHASFLTGLYPHEHGVREHGDRLRSDVPTIASSLRRLGYVTCAVSGNGVVGERYGLSNGFDEVTLTHVSSSVVRQLWEKGWQALGLADRGGKYVTRRAITAMRECTEPWFLLVGYMETHAPYLPPWRFARRFQPSGVGAAGRPFFSARAMNIHRLACTATSEEWEHAVACYDGEVAYADALVGDLVTFLEDTMQLDQTLIIVCADHGDFLGERGLVYHQYGLGEALVGVPLIVRYPPLTKGGLVVDRVVELRDVSRTLVERLGAPSLAPTRYPWRDIFQPDESWSGLAFSEKKRLSSSRRDEFESNRWHRPFLHEDRDAWLVRTDRWEFIAYDDGSCALYDIERDPREEDDLAARECETVRTFSRVLDEFRGKRGARWPRGSAEDGTQGEVPRAAPGSP